MHDDSQAQKIDNTQDTNTAIQADTQSDPNNSETSSISRQDERFFSDTIDSLIKEAETMRLNAMKKHRSRGFISMSFGLIAIIIGACGFGWFLFMEGLIVKGIGSISLGIIFAAYLHFWAAQSLKSYQSDYKAVFLPRIAKALGGFKYFHNRGVSSALLKKTGITPQYDRYSAEDCFMGNYNGVKVMFSEARLYVKAAPQKPIYNGLYILLEVPGEPIKGHTIITADKGLYHKSRPSRWESLQDAPLPEVSNPSWDRFQAVSDKPEETAKFITEDLLKELSEAADIFERSALTAVFFRKKYIFISIPYEGDLFEASTVHAPITTRRTAMQCKQEIEKIMEIIDIFDIYRKN